MVRCSLCNNEEKELYRAVFQREVVNVCENCAKMEGIPIMRKPTQEQLNRADKRYTVRERMLHISGLESLHALSKDHEVAQRHLAKIKIPEKKQESSDLVNNYYWEIKVARRRRKLTLSQLAQLTGIQADVIEKIERGILPKEYIREMIALEKVLGILILRDHERRIKFLYPEKQKTENDIVNEVKDRMSGKIVNVDFKQVKDEKQEDSLEQEDIKEMIRQVKETENERKMNIHHVNENEKQEIQQMQKGELDFSDKRKLKNVTLNDLVEARRQKEKQEKQEAKQDTVKQNPKDLLGSDLEFEE